MIKSILYTKPLTKFPKKIIYLNRINKEMHPEQKEFVVYSTKEKSITAHMRCHRKLLSDRSDYKGDTLYIDYICSDNPENGDGKALINFAKQYSKEIGCNGYIMLVSANFFTPKRIPHLFYRKQGFSSLDKKTDKILDKFIKNGKNATQKQFPSLPMFYPAKKEKPQKSFKEKLVNFYKTIKEFIFKDDKNYFYGFCI